MDSRTTSRIVMGAVAVLVTASHAFGQAPAFNWVPLNVLGMYHFLTESR